MRTYNIYFIKILNRRHFRVIRQCCYRDVFAATLSSWSTFNPHPGHVVAFLGKTVYDDYVSVMASGRRVARISQWGGGCLGVWGFGDKAPSRRRHGGLRAEPPALENFAFFCKGNFILGLFWLKNNAFKTWLRNWQCKHDYTGCINGLFGR